MMSPAEPPEMIPVLGQSGSSGYKIKLMEVQMNVMEKKMKVMQEEMDMMKGEIAELKKQKKPHEQEDIEKKGKADRDVKGKGGGDKRQRR